MNSTSNPQLLFPEFVNTRGSAVSGIVLLLVLLFLSSSKSATNDHFKNDRGERIKEIKKDTRFLRFVKGREISQEGKDLAGDDPYFVSNGGIRELVISTPDQMQEFLRKDYKDHKKAVNMNMGDYAGRLLGQCIGQQNGQHWGTMRSHFDPEFSHKAAAAMIQTFSSEISQWIKDLPKDPIRSSNSPNGSFVQDVVRSCKLLSFRMISITLYGEAFDDTNFARLVELSHLRENLVITAITSPRTASKWYNLFPSAAKRKMDTYLSEWRNFNLDLIRSVRERKISCPAERIYRGVDHDHEMTEVEYMQTLDEILFANIDITGSVLAFVLVNIASQIEFQKKLRTEIAEQKSDAKPLSITDYVARQDSLVHYVILESLRVTPAVNFSPAECTATPKHLSNYLVPAGTPVIIDIRRLNTHPSVWSPDPEVFRPERFADLSPSKYRYALLRFGIGPGRCLGKNMADLLLKMVTMRVVEEFELKVPKEGQGEKDEARFTVSIGGKVEFSKL